MRNNTYRLVSSSGNAVELDGNEVAAIMATANKLAKNPLISGAAKIIGKTAGNNSGLSAVGQKLTAFGKREGLI